MTDRPRYSLQPLKRLLAAALLLLAIGGGVYLLSQESTTPASAATAPPKPPRGGKEGFFGIAPQGSLTLQEAEYMKAGGIESIRWPMLWSAIQPTKRGGYNWESFDPVVETAALEGLQTLPFVLATPPWLAKKYTTLPVNNAAQRKAWVAFLKAAVKRYGPGRRILGAALAGPDPRVKRHWRKKARSTNWRAPI